MPDQVVIAIAAALAAKGAEAMVAGGKSAFAALARLVRGRLAAETHEQERPPRETGDPDGDTGRDRLAEALSRAMAADPTFDARVRDAWRRVSEENTGHTNIFTGRAKAVVQAHDVSGGISF
jgi:hypothetical protein